MRGIRNKYHFLFLLLIATCSTAATVTALANTGVTPVATAAVPEMLEYTEVYDFLDELATDGIIDITEAVKPYRRGQIATWLAEAAQKDSLLNRRQRDDVAFYLQDYALELDTVPDYKLWGHRNVCQWTSRNREEPKLQWNLALVDPSLHLMTNNKLFKFRLRPILGMDIYASAKGAVFHRWYGADIQMDIAHHLAIWGSIRDNSWSRGWGNLTPDNARLTKPQYLNDLPGVQYKEASYGGDFSDSRGGIALYAWWGSIGLQRERLQWGDAAHASNILSAHNPAVPMLTLQLTPCRWFQFDYFHAWLVSNVIDSTYYYTENYADGVTKIHYRPMNKFMAANMFTFKPVKYIHFSFGNSIIYAERTVQAAYFIPIAFFKSLDHLLSKGLGVENQNSQVFASITVRPTDHLKLYGSFFLDEFKFARLSSANPQKNPISYLVGFQWSGWPVRGLSLKGEFMRAYIACYTHSINALAYTSNSYRMGHYMGDNSQSVFAELAYRPVSRLSLKFSALWDTKYDVYDYIRRNIGQVISEKPFNNVVWTNLQFELKANYEIFNNCYAHVNLLYNKASSPVTGAETSTVARHFDSSQEVLDLFSPYFYQGANFTAVFGLSFGF